MDHLPQLIDHPLVHQFPIFGRPGFDQGTFSGYPDRHGFDSALIKRRDYHKAFDGRSSNEVAEFIQNWLYFGFLEAVIGQEINVDDFITLKEGRRCLTTVRLSQIVLEWTRKLPMNTDDPHFRNLDEIIDFVRDLCGSLSRGVRGIYFPPGTKVPKSLLLSIAILGTTLSYAFLHIQIGRKFGFERSDDTCIWRDPGDWGLPRISDTFKALAWCPNDLIRLQDSLFVTGLTYAAGLKRAESVSHTECTEFRCSANDVLQGKPYTCKHLSRGCRCLHTGPLMKDIHTILDNDQFPVLELSLSEDVIEFRVIPYTPGLKFTAISHVWSDGGGNPLGNTIPYCKARWLFYILQPLHEYLNSGDADRVLFWFDTLCVPVSSTNHRNIAIKLMANTYKCASIVLVLDSELQRHYHTRCSPHETLLRIVCSAWMRRVWTLQEAAMSAELMVLCEDGYFNADEAVWELLQELESPDAINPITNEVCRFFVKLRALSYAHHSIRFTCAWMAIYTRQTSIADDECTCFANILGIDPTPILNLGRGDDLSEQSSLKRQSARMQMLFSMLDEVPRNILWADTPKLLLNGFRWAPSSFRGGQLSILSIGYSSLSHELTKRDHTGLHIQSQGVLLHGDWLDPDIGDSCTYILSNGQFVFLEVCSAWHTAETVDRNGKVLDILAYDAHLETVHKAQLALILQGPIQDFRTHTCPVALVSVQQRSEDMIMCRFERLLRMRLIVNPHCELDSNSPDLEAYVLGSARKATLTAEDQTWRVA